VVVQAALSVVLLVGAGLFSQSLGRLQHTDMKLVSKNRYMVHFYAETAGYKDEQVHALYRVLEERFHAIPGVVKVGVSTYTPMEGGDDGYEIQLVGQPNAHSSATNIVVNPEYFDSVGTRVLTGRGITVQDTATSPHVAVVNEDFVRALFKPGENPIGHRFTAGGRLAKPYEIVGVVEGTSYNDVRRNGTHPMYFGPLTQPSEEGDVGAIVVETSQPMSDMESIARRTLMEINPNLAMERIYARADVVDVDDIVRRPGAAVGDGGAVWGDFIHGGAEDERDWHPHGTGRGSQRGGGDDPSQSVVADTARACDRNSCGLLRSHAGEVTAI
jgi:macrolide transport system ATP-binding/permease protein